MIKTFGGIKNSFLCIETQWMNDVDRPYALLHIRIMHVWDDENQRRHSSHLGASPWKENGPIVGGRGGGQRKNKKKTKQA